MQADRVSNVPRRSPRPCARASLLGVPPFFVSFLSARIVRSVVKRCSSGIAFGMRFLTGRQPAMSPRARLNRRLMSYDPCRGQGGRCRWANERIS